MSDRSFGDFLGGGLLATAVIHFGPRLIGSIFSFSGKFVVGFMIFAGIGYFVQVFSGEAIQGEVAVSEVQVSAYGTLDNISVTARNSNSAHLITLLELDCAGENIMFRNIEAGSSQNHSAYRPNVMRGSITCEVIGLRSK